MNIAKTIATVAATAAIALGATFAGSAPATANDVKTIVSDTWKPGFHNNGDGQYVRDVVMSRDTSPRLVTRVVTRDTWAPGFTNDGEGGFERLVSEQQQPNAGSTSIARRDTWAPGYTLDEMSKYTRIVPKTDAAQTATVPADAR